MSGDRGLSCMGFLDDCWWQLFGVYVPDVLLRKTSRDSRNSKLNEISSAWRNKSVTDLWAQYFSSFKLNFPKNFYSFHESNPSIRIWFWFRQDVQSQSINPLYIYTGMSYLFFPARCVLQRNFRFWLRGVMHTTEFDSMVCRTPCSLRGIMHIKNRDSALWCAKDSRTIEHSSSHKIS